MIERPDVEIEEARESEHPIVRVVPADVGALRAELERVTEERDEYRACWHRDAAKGRRAIEREAALNTELATEAARLESENTFLRRSLAIRTRQVRELIAEKERAA